ncbi:hypothetical protein L1987_03077 [Smallanthus sonchifolius]|uniref:Uncharacterized protein n=1 Tax=Smallanthus sonchifolius TaxID=185202 RepID=A0ACB9K9U9_9ASTR|nr:hypothetical protein L1987_03077 [Smallanthus sonchifolius]
MFGSALVTKLDISLISGLNDVVWRGVIEYLGAVEELSIKNCNEIRHLWESEVIASKVLVNLWNLKVEGCDNLVSLGQTEEEDYNRRSNLLTTLRMLEVIHCKNMVCCTCPYSIDKLRVEYCSSITTISLPMGGQKLKSLSIRKLKMPISKWGPQNFPASLIELYLYGDDGVSSCSQFSRLLPSSLTSLRIDGFEELQSVSMGLQHLTSLQHLSFFFCPKMTDLPEGLLPSLLSLVIVGSPKLKERRYSPLISYIPMKIISL